MVSSLTQHYAQLVLDKTSSWPEGCDVPQLEDLLRSLGKWRSRVIANTYIHHHGAQVFGGPFAGMQYLEGTSEGGLVPRLLGCYESELHPYLEAFAAQELDCVIDVGCAEGYYAVGLARMMPKITVHAFDIDETAREACADLARRNGVEGRVVIGGAFAPDGFEAFAGRRALVMVDAEGAELEILQPDQSPALAHMNIIVETHDVFRRGALATMVARFSPTHRIQRVDQQAKAFDAPPWLRQLSHMDQLLATWEWRLRPTPWLVMTPLAAD